MESTCPSKLTIQHATENLLLLQRNRQDGQQDGVSNDTASEPTTILDATYTFDDPTTKTTSPLALQNSNFGPASTPCLLLLHGADTLVFVDPPETVRAKLPPHISIVPHRVHSEKLLATGSAYFKRLFDPKIQTRVKKRRGLTGTLPDGVQYVLDLTPPMLDEDALIFVTQLSCPMSIRAWALQQSTWNLPLSCVGGQEDMEPSNVRLPTTLPDIAADTYIGPDEDSGNNPSECSTWLQDAVPPGIEEEQRLPLEYSASRHCEGVEHILHVLEGLSPNLATPCKLWTFFALAQIFDVASVPAICDRIASWFYELNNVRFIELHPDVTYRVACGIKSSSLCQDAFVELVGDEALLYLIRATPFKATASTQSLVQSRMRDILDDTEVQRIEYASKSFGDYVVRCFLHLAGSEMPWLADIPEFQKLTRHLQHYPEDQEFVLKFMLTLTDFIRDRIYGALCRARDTNRSFHVDPHLRRPESLYQRHPFDREIMLQRLIGKDFWTLLINLDLWRTEPPRTECHSSIADIGDGSLVFLDETAASIRHVSVTEFRHMRYQFNELVRMRAQELQEKEALVMQLAGRHVMMEVTTSPNAPLPQSFESSSKNGPFLNPIPTIPPKSTLPANLSARDFFSDSAFKIEVHSFIEKYALEMLQVPTTATIRHELTDTLTCLTYNEFQYLSLWAGGNDDGTGGVFTDLNIPSMDADGFSGPGPAVHTGSCTSTNESITELDPSDSWGTVRGASHNATYSHVSDLMSVTSTGSARAEIIYANDQSGIYMGEADYDDESTLDVALATGDEEYETQSNSTVTMDRASSILSSADPGDIGADQMADDSDDTEFEVVDAHDYMYA
ncbi:uncharacterized protein N7515_010313 [Penicillium bovifimosum]|uniref:Uncharacterized protein n=1 Tax=Penicillium bovifimosum TaxID=126998 RepID=A0A9W9GIK2_9EURO|nr:uncharacterized protein N7515_010313 [Penicillium bovifimosum]KAJ5120925.1 hypothetical protein N7515_010313 [Penicillium bovifimosum]